MAYDVFISYRRNGGGELAEKIYDELSNVGLSVFLDRRELRFIDFKKQLITNNIQSKVLVVLLSKNSLSYERCKDKDDWIRKEIELFLKLHKRIIFVKFDDFEMPDEFPPSLKKLEKLIEDPQNVIFYNKRGNLFDKAVCILEIKEKVLEKIPEKTRAELRACSDNIGNTSVFREQILRRKIYEKETRNELIIQVVYAGLLLLLCIALGFYEFSSYTLTRIVTACFGVFVVSLKRREMDIVRSIEFSLLNIISGAFVILLIMGFNEFIGLTIVFAISTLTIFVIIYEFIKALLNFINAKVSLHYAQMLMRKSKLLLVPDRIIKDKEITKRLTKKQKRKKRLLVGLCAVIAWTVELMMLEFLDVL